MATLFIIFSVRLVGTLICFCSGAPGGVFAPTLALGTLFGVIFGHLFHSAFPDLGIEPGAFAIAGMGALFAATVRAPITGIVLVTEMTDNYQLILPMMITTIGATLVAQWLGGVPSIPRSWSELYGLLRVKTGVKAASRPVNSLFIRINPAWSRIVKRDRPC